MVDILDSKNDAEPGGHYRGLYSSPAYADIIRGPGEDGSWGAIRLQSHLGQGEIQGTIEVKEDP
jgi:hypothetical protein